jgi:hypothetical protein
MSRARDQRLLRAAAAVSVKIESSFDRAAKLEQNCFDFPFVSSEVETQTDIRVRTASTQVLDMWFLRVPKEEGMMAERFGADWDACRARTGRLWPGMKP